MFTLKKSLRQSKTYTFIGSWPRQVSVDFAFPSCVSSHQRFILRSGATIVTTEGRLSFTSFLYSMPFTKHKADLHSCLYTCSWPALALGRSELGALVLVIKAQLRHSGCSRAECSKIWNLMRCALTQLVSLSFFCPSLLSCCRNTLYAADSTDSEICFYNVNDYVL